MRAFRLPARAEGCYPRGLSTTVVRSVAEDTYRKYFDNAPHGAFVVDAAGNYLEVNAAACRLTGYSEEELLRMSIRDLAAPERLDETVARFAGLLETGRMTSDALCRRPDESRFWLEIHAVRLDEDRYIGFASDVTEQRRLIEDLAARVEELKQSERALRESEERFRAFYAASFEGIVITERGRVVDANDRCAAILGYEREEIIGKEVSPLMVAPEDREMVMAHMRTSYERPYQHKALHKNGSKIDVEVCGRTVQLDGRPVRITALHDVTERVKAEEERLALMAQIQHAQKLESLGILAGGIAHDFNNLLVGILGNADLALLELPSDSNASNQVCEISTIARRCAELTNQMLAYAGKGRFVVEEVDLRDLIPELKDLLRSSLSKKVTLELQLATELPVIKADPSQLHQVILNLVTNASEAIGEEAGQVVVRAIPGSRDSLQAAGTTLVDELPAGPCALLEVRDTGCGMTPETQARIFEPFFTTKFTGRGLGMAAVHGIVRAHKGRIDVQSEPGVGTTFRICFPALANVGAPTTTVADYDPSWRGSGVVLLVDDEELVRKVGKKILERLGFAVLVAPDGTAAIDVFCEHEREIACVLLDLKMPNLDGEETLLRLRQIHKDVPVVLSSGYTEEEASARCIEAGISGFVQKPYQIATLQRTLQSILG